MDYTILLIDSRQEVIDIFNTIDWGEEFSVEVCASGQEGLSYLKEQPVHLIYLANQLSDMESEEFLVKKGQIHGSEKVPVIILSDEPNYKIRIQQMMEGTDDYFILPFNPRELEVRARILLREIYSITSIRRSAAKGFSGDLAEMNLLDLLQTLELGRKTGVVHLQRNLYEAKVHIVDGLVYDAEWDNQVGEEALFRLFTWTEGYFSVTFEPVNRDRQIRISAPELTMRGLKILEEWEKLRNDFPNFNMVPQMEQSFEEDDVKPDWHKIVSLIDGIRNLQRIIELSPVDEMQTLTFIRQMHIQGYLSENLLELEEELNLTSGMLPEQQSAIGADKLQGSINAYMEGFLGKRNAGEMMNYPDAKYQSGGTNGERGKIRPAPQFDKVELQYIKRKLL
ncbi:MAG TPA: response regulator [Bacteroidetes bacterium]|nr:response regulator [Bacteroidota bacterium]